MRQSFALAGLLAVLSLAGQCRGQTLQETLDDLDVGERWKYNDWETARAAANLSGKPILALFR